MSVNVINPNAASTTSRGTKIIKPGADMDKNAFLKILTAELSNQDPTEQKDSTAYVAQMAQFSSLEQMSNLNTSTTMSSANSMIGRMIMTNSLDTNGNPNTGIVRVVTKQGSDIKLGVDVSTNGTPDIQEFTYDDIAGVSDSPYASNDTASTNSIMELLTEASMIGKKAEFSDLDVNGKNLTGVINGIVKNGSTFDLNVLLDGTGDIKELPISDITKLNNSN